MATRPSSTFLQRPQGEAPLPIGDAAGSIEDATRVVLQAADGRVLVKNVHRHANGSYVGEVYGVMPNQRSVATGDIVHFEASQILRFKAEGPQAVTDMDPETLDLVRTFERRYSELLAQSQPEQPVAEPSDPAWSLDAQFGDLSAALRPSETAAAPPPAPERVEPVLARNTASASPPPKTSAPQPVVTPAPKPAEPPSAPTSETPRESPPSARVPPTPASAAPQPERVIKCIECGAGVKVPPAQTKVSCHSCGRINRVD